MRKNIILVFAILCTFFNLTAQVNEYPTSGDVKIVGYSPTLILQRNTDISGFIQGVQTKLLVGTNNWYFGSIHVDQRRISKDDYSNIKIIILSIA